MCPPAASPLPDIDTSSTYEEFFGSLEKMNKGHPLPSNVINDVDPYNFMPSNLPDGLWFLVPYQDKTSAQHEHWKAKGEACEIFSNSVITGWRTTFEFYEGQNPHERKTDWVMQEFRITQKKRCESKKAEDASSLCRVFSIDKLSSSHEKQQKMAAADITGGTHIHTTELSSAIVMNDRSQGSTSKPQVNNDDDETREMAAMERLANCLVETLSEINYLSGDDYLELCDLDYPLSPSSSSENSSCMTMSSDEYFDSLALLQELETKNNDDIVQENAGNAGYKYSFSTSHKPNEVVMFPESLVSIERSKSTSEEIFKSDSSIPDSAMASRNLDNQAVKQVIKVQKADYRNEGPSSNSQYPATTSDTDIAIPRKKRKPTVGRIKQLKKKYFCFMPF